MLEIFIRSGNIYGGRNQLIVSDAVLSTELSSFGLDLILVKCFSNTLCMKTDFSNSSLRFSWTLGSSNRNCNNSKSVNRKVVPEIAFFRDFKKGLFIRGSHSLFNSALPPGGQLTQYRREFKSNRLQLVLVMGTVDSQFVIIKSDSP